MEGKAEDEQASPLQVVSYGRKGGIKDDEGEEEEEYKEEEEGRIWLDSYALFRRLPVWLRCRLNYFRLHVCYIVLVGLMGALAIYVLEEKRHTFLDCLFTGYAAITLTGFVMLDPATLSGPSHVVIFILTSMGGAVITSIIPVYLRCQIFEKKVREAYHMKGMSHKALRSRLEEVSVEYRALRYIYRITIIYWIAVQVGAALAMGFYVEYHAGARELLASRGVNRWWWAFFHSTSAFINSGYSLFADSMMPWINHHFILIIMGSIIVLGNTGFPVAIRLIVVTLDRIQLWSTGKRDPALTLLLDHPRRCYTHLFGHSQTLNLVFLILVFFVADLWLSYHVEFHAPLYSHMDIPTRFVVFFFQATSKRSAGFTVMDMSKLAASVSVLCILMMYLAIAPVWLTMKATREEGRPLSQSLSRIVQALKTNRFPSFSRKTSASPFPPPPPPPAKKRRLGSHAEVPLPRPPQTTVPTAIPTFDDHPLAYHIISAQPKSPQRAANSVPNLGWNPYHHHAHRHAHRHVEPLSWSLPWGPHRIEDLETGIRRESSTLHKVGDLARQKGTAIAHAIQRELSKLKILKPVDGDEEEDLDESPYVENERGGGMFAVLTGPLPLLFFALFTICVAEDQSIKLDTTDYVEIWPIFYEVISAYGTCGLSMGFPDTTTALTAKFSPISRIVIIILMLLGRHRGLPDSIDPAVKIPKLEDERVTRRSRR